jgi:quercetin dioxygenase-like cupin family protein
MKVTEPIRKNDRIDVLGVELEWKLKRSDTLDQYCVLTATVPPGIGIPPHRHPDQEAFFVLEGQPEFAMEEGGGLAWNAARPGDMINITPDALHGFRNQSNGNVKVLITCAAGLGRFFEEAGTPLAEDEPACLNISPETIQRVLAIAEKHGQRFLAPA